MIWRMCYDFMVSHPGWGRRLMWGFLRRSRLLDLFCDEGYLKVSLLGKTGERFAAAAEGGGINSLIIAQMLHWRSDLPTICCDKIAVRGFVRSRGLGDILVPLVPGEETWETPEEIPWDRLPSQFVLKCNNGSGFRLIVRDKSEHDLTAVRRKVRRWLQKKYGRRHRERQYAGVKNCLFAEQLLSGESGGIPEDYKIMCSNGRPLFAWVDSGRFLNHERTVYDLQFRKMDVTIGYPACPQVRPRPKGWDRMLQIAGELSRGIPIVRIDLYNIHGRIYFGEMTFSSDGARSITRPFEFSNRMARLADPICRPE